MLLREGKKIVDAHGVIKMKAYLVLMLLVVAGAISTGAGDQVSLAETENYTIRLKNNSDHMTLLKIGQAPADASCDQATDINIYELGVGKVMDLRCGPAREKRYCISTINDDNSAELRSWVQFDCAKNISPVLNLNLFGR